MRGDAAKPNRIGRAAAASSDTAMSVKLIRSKFVTLDSSHLINVVRDTFSHDGVRREKAAAFERAFESSGCVLLLSWHHLQELLSHENEAVIKQRLEYFASKPLVGCLKSLAEESVPGSIIDIQAMEVAAAFKSPGCTLSEVRDVAAAKMFALAAGRDTVRPFLESWSPVSEAFSRQGHRNREIVAISRSDFAGVGHLKVVDFLKQAARSPEDIAHRLGQLSERLENEIRTYGDKRIRDPLQTLRTAQSFIDDIARFGSNLAQGEHPGLKILSMFGVDASEIGPETTIDDIGRWSTFRKKLQIINQLLGLPFNELKATVTAERLPSSVIQTALDEFRPETPEWKGSDLPDGYLASLVAYADITFVDKRTYEALRQARSKAPLLATILKRVDKAGDYSTIATIVAAT
jgi:hypothetical protein